MAAAQVVPEVPSQPPPELAVLKIVVEAPSQPPPEPALGREFPGLALAKVLMYLCLACAWVECAAFAGAIVARRARGEASRPVVDAFFKVVIIGALLFDALVLVVLLLLLLRAMLVTEFRLSLSDLPKEATKMLDALTWKLMLRDTTVLGLLALFSFFPLIVIAALMFAGLLPVEESQRVRIAYALLDVGALGCMAMSCFIILPSLALKLWRMK